MKTLTIEQIQELVENPTRTREWCDWSMDWSEVIPFVRWSNGPDLEREDGCSRCGVSGQAHNGLSVNPIRFSDRDHIERRIREYSILGKLKGVRPWFGFGSVVGKDSDGTPTVEKIEACGWIEWSN